MILPADDYILLSLINTKLRDEYPSLESLCREENVEKSVLCARLERLGFYYDESQNAFR